VKQTVGGEVTYSVYSKVSGKVSVVDNMTSGEKFVILNLGPVSLRVKAGGVAEYTALDHLGSPVAATAANGALLWRESFNPFGEQRVSPAANDNKPGFTGHVDDAATGLTYMQARYYDPVLGRFLSTDPMGYQDQMNLYAYVGNDPVNVVDPTGTMKLERPDPAPVREYKTLEQKAGTDGSVSIQRSKITDNGIANPGTVASAGVVKLTPQASDGGNPAVVTTGMQEKLLNFSEKVSKAVEVTSGIRTPEQNRAVGGAPQSAHLDSEAADIRIAGQTANVTADQAHASGEFNRVNEYTDGRGVHVDTRETGNQGRLTNWRPVPD
jgi:RHS repeat-associated protein